MKNKCFLKTLRLIVAAIVFAMTCLVGLVGCADDAAGSEIIVWWPSGKTMHGIINEAVEDFKASHQDAKIKIVNKPMDAFDAYKYALNDDKTRPDVAILDHVYVAALAKEGMVADLTTLGSNNIKSKYPENVYNANTYAGDAYGLPFSANTIVLMYNKDILSACGITEIPTTLESLLSACQTISNKGYIAFAQPQDSFAVMAFMPYVSRNGGKIISDDYKTVLFNDTGVKKAIDDWVALSKYASKATYEEDKFYNGKVAFIEMGSWHISDVTGSMQRFNCGFSEMVTIDSNYSNYSGLGLYSLCVAEKSRNKTLAYEFAAFLSTDKKVQLAFNKDKNLFPVTKDALTDSYYTDNEILNIYARQLEKVTPRPATPVWPDMEKALQSMLYEIVRTDSTDYTSIINKYQAQVQQATDRAFK